VFLPDWDSALGVVGSQRSTIGGYCNLNEAWRMRSVFCCLSSVQLIFFMPRKDVRNSMSQVEGPNPWYADITAVWFLCLLLSLFSSVSFVVMFMLFLRSLLVEVRLRASLSASERTPVADDAPALSCALSSFSFDYNKTPMQ
jgi:flagellar biosynthesis protein FliP